MHADRHGRPQYRVLGYYLHRFFSYVSEFLDGHESAADIVSFHLRVRS